MPVIASQLDQLLKERDKILKDIGQKQSEINGTSLDELKHQIELEQNHRESILTEFKELQNYIVQNSNNLSQDDLLISQQRLIVLCKSLSESDKLLNNLNKDLVNKSKSLLKNSNNTLLEQLNTLCTKLNDNTEKTGKERENIRLNGLKKETSLDLNINIGGGLKNGMQKIWIDENLGIYIMYDKVGVISTTMKCFFKGVGGVPDSTLKDVGYDGGLDQLYENISQIDVPGLPTLLSVFIDLIIKAVGNFGKNFYAFKNTIDLLAGLELGELLGMAIPGIGKVLTDLKLFFSDTKKWLFKNMMGPLFDLNIPIPAFKFDLGAIIPFLPFKIPIPGIDPHDFLKKMTPFNIHAIHGKFDEKGNVIPNSKNENCKRNDIPLDWLQKIQKEEEDALKEEDYKLNATKESKIEEIEKLIQSLKDKKNIDKIKSDLEKQLLKEQNKLNNLKDQLLKKKEDAMKSNTDLLSIENDMISLCKKMNESSKKIQDLKNRIKNLKPLSNKEIDDINKQIQNLETKKKETKDRPILNSKEIKRLALTLRLEQGLDTSIPVEDELQSIRDLGVNIYDHDNLQYIQKLGYNFKNADHKDKLLSLKTKGIQLDETKLLMRLYSIGLNINDPNFLTKLDKMKSFGINILDTKLLSVYLELGFNFNHYTIFDTMNSMNDLSIDMNNYDLLVRLNMLGFNFNNPNIISNVSILKKYVDLTKTNAYDNAISKNVNFNNPYFENLMKNYTVIGLSFDSNNFKQTEKEILTNVKVTDINTILEFLNVFKKTKGEYYKYIDKLNSKYVSFNAKYSSFIKLDLTPTSYIKDYTSQINIYSIYNIKMDELYTLESDSKVQSSTGKTFKNTIFEDKLNLLKEFVINKGWKISGVNSNINENISQDDLQKIASENGLTVTTSLNPPDGQINQDVLEGLYGNFNKLGLNIRDKEFKNKFDIFQKYFNIKIDGSVLLDTTRHVYLDTNRVKNNKGEWTTTKDTITIDLGNQKPDPDIYDEGLSGFANIRTENILNPALKKQPTKTIVKFDSLNQLGYNFQKSDYSDVIKKLSGLYLDINQFETVDIINGFISIGFHLSDIQWVKKLSLLETIGFNFKVPDKIDNVEDSPSDVNYDYSTISSISPDSNSTDKPTIEISISGRLDQLNNMGFNFSKSGYDKMIKFLKDVGIDFQNKWFDNAITELNNFGINFNDKDWSSKCDKFKQFEIYFNTPEWIIKMSNLTQLGIDFNGDWNTKFNNAMNLVSYGLDYNILDLREKLAILLQLGVDFEQPDDVYKEQIESLIDIGLVWITDNKMKERADLSDKYIQQLNDIDQKIQDKQAEIDGSSIKTMDTILQKNKNKETDISNNINLLKSKMSNNLSKDELLSIEKQLLDYCNQLSTLNENNKKLSLSNDAKKNEINNKGLDKLKLELSKLISEKNSIQRIKPYRLNNYTIHFAELEKFKELDNLNISFYDTDSCSECNVFCQIKKLIAAGFSFAKSNWKDLVKKFLNFLPGNPILQWIKTIIKTITNILSMPLKTLFAFIKKLIDLIGAVLGIPLNPAKIPSWAKKIIKKFKDLISMIIKLPTPEGIMDFLFMSTEGLMLIDIFLPGFADFMKKSKSFTKNKCDDVKKFEDKSKEMNLMLSRIKDDNNNKILDLQKELNLKNILLNGGIPDEFDKNEQKILNEQKTLSSLIDNLKNMIKNKDLSNLSISDIEKQLQDLCSKLNKLEDDLNNNKNELNNLNKISKDDLLKDIDNLNKSINDLKNDKNLEKAQKDLDNINNKLKDAITACKLGNFCKWNENIDLVIGMIRGFASDIEKTPNKSKNKLDDNREKTKQLELDRKELNDTLNNIKSPNGSINNIINPIIKKELYDLNKSKKDIEDKISKLESFICANKDTMTDAEFNKYMSQLNDLNQLNKNIDNDINNKSEKLNVDSTPIINDLNDKINDITKKINDLNKENVDLKKESDKFEEQKSNDLANLDGIEKFIGVLINVVCCSPKMIVNIIISILNSIAYMKNLPILWNIPFVE